MKAFFSLMVIFCLTTSNLCAQEVSRWHITLSGEWALPVGDYQRIAPEKAVIEGGDINGFDKEGNSAADFPYEMGLRLVLGGSSGALDKPDEVTYRQVQLGFLLGYSF